MAITQLYIKGQQDVYFSPPFFQSSFHQHNPISKHVLQQEPEPRYSYQQHYFIFILSSLWSGCISILSWSSLSQCSTLTNNHHTIGWHVYIFKHILSLSFGAPDHRIYIHNIAPSISFVSGVPGEHVLDRMLFFFPLSSPHMYTFIMFIHIAYIFAFNLSSFLSYHLHKDELSTRVIYSLCFHEDAICCAIVYVQTLKTNCNWVARGAVKHQSHLSICYN